MGTSAAPRVHTPLLQPLARQRGVSRAAGRAADVRPRPRREAKRKKLRPPARWASSAAGHRASAPPWPTCRPSTQPRTSSARWRRAANPCAGFAGAGGAREPPAADNRRRQNPCTHACATRPARPRRPRPHRSLIRHASWPLRSGTPMRDGSCLSARPGARGRRTAAAAPRTRRAPRRTCATSCRPKPSWSQSILGLRDASNALFRGPLPMGSSRRLRNAGRASSLRARRVPKPLTWSPAQH